MQRRRCLGALLTSCGCVLGTPNFDGTLRLWALGFFRRAGLSDCLSSGSSAGFARQVLTSAYDWSRDFVEMPIAKAPTLDQPIRPRPSRAYSEGPVQHSRVRGERPCYRAAKPSYVLPPSEIL